MICGVRTKNATVAATRMVTVTVTTAEMASQASLPRRVVRWSTKTGTKVAESTPPMHDVGDDVGGGVGQVVGVGEAAAAEGRGEGDDPAHAGDPGQRGADGHARRWRRPGAAGPPPGSAGSPSTSVVGLGSRRDPSAPAVRCRSPASSGPGLVSSLGAPLAPALARGAEPPDDQHGHRAEGEDHAHHRGGGGPDADLAGGEGQPAGRGVEGDVHLEQARRPGLDVDVGVGW